MKFEAEDIQAIVTSTIEGLKPLLFKQQCGGGIDDLIYDISGLCDYLKVSRKWVYDRSHLKEIPHFKLSNKQLRFRKKDIDKWLESLKIPSINEYRGTMKVMR